MNSADHILQAILPTNWLFSAVLTVVCLAYIVWTLGRSKVRAYFGLHEPFTARDQSNGDQA